MDPWLGRLLWLRSMFSVSKPVTSLQSIRMRAVCTRVVHQVRGQQKLLAKVFSGWGHGEVAASTCQSFGARRLRLGIITLPDPPPPHPPRPFSVFHGASAATGLRHR